MFDAPVPAPGSTETTSFDALNSLPSAETPQHAGARPESNRPFAELLASELPPFGPPASEKKCPEALAAEITTLAGHLNAAQYRFLKLLDEFDREQGWAGPGIRSLAHWLNWKCGLGELVAREKVRVARALRELPMIDASFERGQISYSKVRAMTRAATPGNESQLLNIARHGTAEHIERLVRVYRRCRKRADTSPGETERRREERFYCFDEDEETTVFGGRVSAEQGRLLMKALDAMVAEMEDDERAANEAPRADDTHPAGDEPGADDAHRDGDSHRDGENGGENRKVAQPGKAVDHSPNDAPESAENVSAETFSEARHGHPPLKPIRVRRATALVQIAEHYLATGGSGATPLKSSEAHQVFVHVNANDAHPDNRINGEHTTYADNRRCLAPHVARQLACDASRRTVLENERGEVLNIGRRSRTVPWRIAHALRLRDGGCRFPGCNQHRWTDAHHIRHWADGGETSLDNLVTLCRHHHRSLHRDEYRIERGTDGGLVFIDARRQPIPLAIHPQFGDGSGSGNTAGAEVAPSAADRVEQLQAEHRERSVEIDKSTAVTRWAGERMDYSTAVEWLLSKDGVAI